MKKNHEITRIKENAYQHLLFSRRCIHEWVTDIGDSAFAGNDLESVIIRDSVTTIGKFAFHGNYLTSVIIPDSVTTIGEQAFSYNELLSLTIGRNVETIGENAFKANNFWSVFFMREDIRDANYDDSAFEDISSKPTLYIPTGAVGYPEPSITPVRWLGATWCSVVEMEA